MHACSFAALYTNKGIMYTVNAHPAIFFEVFFSLNFQLIFESDPILSLESWT